MITMYEIMAISSNRMLEEMDKEIRKQRRIENRIDEPITTSRLFNNRAEGSASISYSTLSAIGDSIAEMYGREYSENFMRNF